MLYSVKDGSLEIRDSSTGQLKWQGRIEGGTVIRAVALPGTEDCVALIEYCEQRATSNLARISPDGTVVWRVSPAPEFGPYVNVGIRDGTLVAWSWSGYMVKIDPNVGSISEKVFVK